MSVSIKVGQLQTRAAFQASTFDDSRGSVEVTFTTGARGLRSTFFGEKYFEELEVSAEAVDLSRLNNGASVLNSHSSFDVKDVIGVVERAWIANGEGRALVRFSDREDVKAIRDDVKAGILRHISVGYTVAQYDKTAVAPDGTPVYRAVKWTPAEISIVPVAFDDRAVVRASNVTPHEVPVFSKEHQNMSDEIKAAAEAKAQETRAAELKTATDAAAAAAVKAERERQAGILLAVRSVKLGDEFAQKMIDGNVSVEAARAAVLDEMAKRTEATPIEAHVTMKVTDDQQDKFVRGVSAWLFEKAGNGLVEAAKQKNVKGFEKVETDGGEYRGMSLLDVARECLERRGVRTRHMYNKFDLISQAMNHRAAGASTSDFSVLFENVMHKQMRAAYAVTSDTWKRFCRTDTVSDFRNSNRYLNGTFGALDLKPENAEYQNKAIPDGAKTSISVQTYGNMIGVSREAIINDDMGALADVAARFGRAAGLTIEKAVYTMLALNAGLGPTMSDSLPFFDASRGNISTGAALSVAALSADKVAFRAQQDISSNEYLDLTPSILLVPTALEDPAKVLNRSAWDNDSTKLQKPNAVQGLFSDIVSSPRLSWSTTRRYLFTAEKEAFVVVFLEGAGEGPTMESQQGWRVDGLEWKARIDAKAQAFDPKTALTNAGT